VTGSDVTWPQVTGSDPEVTSFDRKSPRSGCRRLKTRVYCAFDFLQGYCSQEEAVTWQEMTSRDLRWPEVTWKWRHLTGSHLEVAVEGSKLAYTWFDFLNGCNSRRRQSRDRKWRHVTAGDQEVTSFDRKLPGSSCRSPKTLIYCVWLPTRLYLAGGGSHVPGNHVTWT